MTIKKPAGLPTANHKTTGGRTTPGRDDATSRDRTAASLRFDSEALAAAATQNRRPGGASKPTFLSFPQPKPASTAISPPGGSSSGAAKLVDLVAGFEPLLTIETVANVLNLSIRQIRRLVADRTLPVVRIGKAVRVRPEDLRNLIGQADGG